MRPIHERSGRVCHRWQRGLAAVAAMAVGLAMRGDASAQQPQKRPTTTRELAIGPSVGKAESPGQRRRRPPA